MTLRLPRFVIESNVARKLKSHLKGKVVKHIALIGSYVAPLVLFYSSTFY